MRKRILSMLLTLLMLASLLPAAYADWTVPEGYDEYEYNKLAAFLEIEDGSGVKNGTKLNENYDVNDPSTWGDGWVYFPFGDAPYYVYALSGWRSKGLVGSLDISGFAILDSLYLSGNLITSINASNCHELSDVEVDRCGLQSLDLSNCESLYWLVCDNNQLSSLNVSGCTGITTGIHCDNNLLTTLDVSYCVDMVTLVCNNNKLENLNVSNCAALSTLNAQNNALSSIDLSDCASLQVLNLSGNRFKSIDTSPCPNLHLDSVTAVGPGTVGYWETLQGSNTLAVLYAYPNEDALFLGWYNADGELLSTEPEWNASSVIDSIGTAVTAKFRWNLPDGIYLVGTMNEWAPTAADLFDLNPNSSGEYMLQTSLAVGDEIKVIESVGGNWTWYPPDGDNYTVDKAHSGDVTIYFQKTQKPDWAEFGGYFYIPAKHSLSLTTVGSGTAGFAPEAPSTGDTVTLTVTPEEGNLYDYTEIYKITGTGENDKELVELGSLQWNDEELSFEMPDYDILIAVYFKAKTVTVIFDAGEEAEQQFVTREVKSGEAIGELPTPTREDWVFLGWFTEPAASYLLAGQGSQVNAETSFTADATIYAHWRLPGDINGDGKVTNKDVTALQRHLKYSDVQVMELNEDVNGDGKVTNKDVTALQRYIKYHDVEIH